MQMYSESDVDTAILSGQQITILGYGSQGRAHALNLKDSGFDVVIGLRSGGASWSIAEADGHTVKEPSEAVHGAAIVAFLTPDMVQKQLYATVVDADVGAFHDVFEVIDSIGSFVIQERYVEIDRLFQTVNHPFHEREDLTINDINLIHRQGNVFQHCGLTAGLRRHQAVVHLQTVDFLVNGPVLVCK